MNAYKTVKVTDSNGNTVTAETIITDQDTVTAIPVRSLTLDAAKIAKAQADAQWIMSKFGK